MLRQIVGKPNPSNPILRPDMVCRGNDFGLIESGNSDIDFVSLGLAHESQRAAARSAE
jgi:hypothetical protein